MEEELSPQQAERVRRLLAEARHTEPMPDDVAARLDRVLADLATEPDEQPSAAEPARVVRLAERRRRAGRLLLAAAVVVVGGVAVGRLVGGATEGGGSSESADSAVSSEAEDGDRGLPAPERGDEGDSAGGGRSGPGAVSGSRRSFSKLPAQRIRSSDFAADAERLRPAATGAGLGPAAQGRGSAAYDATCAPGAWGGGRYVRVGFDRRPGWLVYRPPQGDTQVVDLFLCGEDAAERSTTLPTG